MSGPQNRTEGAQFEEILEIHCRTQDTLPIKFEIGTVPIGNGAWKRKKPPFDYALLHNGTSVFVDCKSLGHDKLLHSDLDQDQVKHLVSVWEKEFIAGYIVWHRNINAVVFYEAEKLLKLKPRESLSPQDGIYLGRFDNIALGALFYHVIDIGENHGKPTSLSEG